MANGYDPDFIGDGVHIPLPKTPDPLGQSVLTRHALRDGVFSDHVNFTLVMNRHTRQLIYSAFNMDQSQLRALGSDKGVKSWSFPDDIGEENQVGNDFYKDRLGLDGRKVENPFDRSHMVMRHNAMWGATDEIADAAGKATFIYANASLQHKNLNRDEWRALEEDVVRAFGEDANGRLTVFTGPIFGTFDRGVHLSDTQAARVPSAFFKVICYRSKSSDPAKKLGVKSFVIFQDRSVLQDRKGAATVKTDQRYQFTVSEIQLMTGIDFGAQLYERNPLVFTENTARDRVRNISMFPERIPIASLRDAVDEADDTRTGIQGLQNRGVVLQAAMINPIGSEAENEWITLFNRMGDPLSVEGWRLVDGKDREAILTGEIAPGATLRIAGEMRGGIKLSNTGGSLMLRDAEGTIIDHATWTKRDVERVQEGMAYIFERGQ